MYVKCTLIPKTLYLSLPYHKASVNGYSLNSYFHAKTKLVSPLVEGVEDVEWSTVVGAVKRQYVRV